ncbi:MAG: hypothetical protein ABJA62_02635 [Luteimonas sp.]
MKRISLENVNPRVNRAREISGVDVGAYADGYTLSLRCSGKLFPILADDGRKPKHWRNLDRAIAFLVSNFGSVAPIHLNVAENSSRIDSHVD